MNSLLRNLLSYSIFFPCIVGLVRYRFIPRQYQPFLWFIFIGTLTELLATLWIIPAFHTTALLTNIYSLLECELLLLQFYNWRLGKQFPRLYWVLPAFMFVFWFTENLLMHFKTDFSSYFRIIYPFALVLLSINEINYLVVYEGKALFKNARFLLCVSMLIFFAYQILLVGSVHIIRSLSHPFTERVFYIHIYINTFVNFMYGIGLLCIPGKKYQLWNDKLDRLIKENESNESS